MDEIINYADLKPDKNNFGFNIEVLEKVFLKKLKKPFSTKSMFKIMSGAKGFGKTYLICLLAWFYWSNFLDFNVLLAKYTFVSAKDNYYFTMRKVAKDLEEFGVTIYEEIFQGKGWGGKIKQTNKEGECQWQLKNGRVIKIIGFDNTSTWEGIPAPEGEWGMFAIDEVIPINEIIDDEENYLYQLFNILVQIVRGKKLATSKEAFAELKSEDFQIYKQHLVIFGFNNHDTSHPIYQVFVNAIAPLTEKIKFELENNAVSFSEDENFLNVGATVIRGTTEINDENLNKKLKDFGFGIKEKFPEIYDTLFLGSEREFSIDRYSYRKDLLANAIFFNPEEFFWKNEKRYWFDEIRIGSDYADGGELGDDAVTILIGFEFDFKGIVQGIYILEELSISTRKYKNMTSKVKDIANHLNDWSKLYQSTKNQIPLKDNMKFRIGQDSRTVKDFLIEILVKNFNFKKEALDQNFSCFKASGNKGWLIANRHGTWKRLLSEKKLFFSTKLKVTQEINGFDIEIKKNGYLYDELFNCLNDQKKNIRDERAKINKLDAINAAEHALSYFRFALFE